MALDDRPELLGLYLYHAGVSFVAASSEQIAEQKSRARLDENGQWWDFAGLLAYWHEADHYQTFSCSPYLQHALNLGNSYSWWCTTAISECAPADGWSKVELPLLLARQHGSLPPRASTAVDLAAAARIVIHQMLHGQVTESMANRLTFVTRASATYRSEEDCRFRAEVGEPPSSPLFPGGLTASDLYEAMGRLTELGHLMVLGASPEQIDFWANSMIFGQYERALGPLLRLMDTDLIHAALVLAFRSPVFPYLATDSSNPDRILNLGTEHPVSRFINMTNFMLSSGMAQAPAELGRSTESTAQFHDSVIDELIARFPVVRDDSQFRATEDLLWASVKAENARSPTGWERILREVDDRATARARRFALELRDQHKWLVSEPTMIPWALLTDAEFDGTDGYFPRRDSADVNIGGHELQATYQAVGDIVVFGDPRLYASVSEIFGHAPDRMGLLRLGLKALGIDRTLDSIPSVSWDDELDQQIAQTHFESKFDD